MKTVTVYAADWRPLTERAIASGKEIGPAIDIGGEVLSEPSDAELEAALL